MPAAVFWPHGSRIGPTAGPHKHSSEGCPPGRSIHHPSSNCAIKRKLYNKVLQNTGHGLVFSAFYDLRMVDIPHIATIFKSQLKVIHQKLNL